MGYVGSLAPAEPGGGGVAIVSYGPEPAAGPTPGVSRSSCGAPAPCPAPDSFVGVDAPETGGSSIGRAGAVSWPADEAGVDADASGSDAPADSGCRLAAPDAGAETAGPAPSTARPDPLEPTAPWPAAAGAVRASGDDVVVGAPFTAGWASGGRTGRCASASGVAEGPRSGTRAAAGWAPEAAAPGLSGSRADEGVGACRVGAGPSTADAGEALAGPGGRCASGAADFAGSEVGPAFVGLAGARCDDPVFSEGAAGGAATAGDGSAISGAFSRGGGGGVGFTAGARSGARSGARAGSSVGSSVGSSADCPSATEGINRKRFRMRT